MTGEPDRTRRNVLKLAAASAVGGSFAGCVGDIDQGAPNTDPADDAGGETASDGEAGTGTSTETNYTASMEPVGEVTFESVPEAWVANNGSWADMGIALGLEPPKGVWLTNRYHTQYYDEIDGVSVDAGDMVDLYQDGVSKELFYELDGDLHAIDPNFLMNRFKGWTQEDVDEISENVGPFFGNSIFSTGYPWHEDYRYYTLYEGFGKLAEAFRRTDRYEAFASLHEEFRSSLADVAPPEDERPAVAVMWAAGNEPEEFSPYLIGKGTSFKQWRDLGVRDALAETDVRDFHATRGHVDYETLLEIDPPVLLLRGHENQTGSEFRDTVVAYMEGHDVASRLTAVENGDVYRGGPLYQGPITNLVVTERAARQLYGVEEELFDRARVAEIVEGDAGT